MDKKLYIDKDTLKNIRSIKTERERRGLRQADLANFLGISQTTVSKYEIGLCIPKFQIYEKLAELFNWNIENDINYEFFYKRKNVKKLKNKYYLSCREICEHTGITYDLVEKSVYRNKFMSINTYEKIMYLINEEKRLAEYRKKCKQ